MLDVECSVVPGTGSLELTVNLGDVKESAKRLSPTFAAVWQRCG